VLFWGVETHGRLVEARKKLEAKDLAGALAIYDEVLAADEAGAGALAAASADLGASGHLAELIQVIAPLYDSEKHGAAAGLNLLQAYLATNNPDAARHVLGLLMALDCPELEERLRGFGGAVDQMVAQRKSSFGGSAAPALSGSMVPPPPIRQASLVNISKPIWFYGLESMAAAILPSKEGRLRRIAFAQISLSGIYEDVLEASREPEDEFGRFARGFPLWLAETFYFSPAYAPIAAVAVVKEPDGRSLPLLFGEDWTIDNLHQLADATQGGLDYIVTGALTCAEAEHRLLLRVWEVKKFRERKQFGAHWTAATADSALADLQRDLCRFMECSAGSGEGLANAPPASPRAWIDVLAASLGLFLAGKGIYPVELLAPLAPVCSAFAPHAADSPAASLAWLTLLDRARSLGIDAASEDPVLAGHPAVEQARARLTRGE
jgi:hypothetical protein